MAPHSLFFWVDAMGLLSFLKNGLGATVSAADPLPVQVVDGSSGSTMLGLPTADAQTSVSTSITTVQLLAARTARKRIAIYNPAGSDLSIGNQTPVTVANTFTAIPSKGTLFLDLADFPSVSGAWHGLLSSGTGTAQVRESY
jgi:hypothetical protein